MIDRDAGQIGSARISVCDAVAPANRVVFQRAPSWDRRANALEVATAFADIELAELAGIRALNTLYPAAYLPAHVAVFIARRAAAVIASPNAVSAAGVPLQAADRETRRARLVVGVATFADLTVRHAGRVGGVVVTPPLAVPTAGRALEAKRIAIRAGLLIGIAAVAYHAVFFTGRVQGMIVTTPLAVRTAGRTLEAERLVVGDAALTRESVLAARRIRAGVVTLPPAIGAARGAFEANRVAIDTRL